MSDIVSKFDINDKAFYFNVNDYTLYEVIITNIKEWNAADGFVYDICWKNPPRAIYTGTSEKNLFSSKEEFFNSIQYLEYEEFDDTIVEDE